MKILYYHQHFSTPSGSTGTRSYEFAKKLIKNGHEVTMVCGTTAMGDSGLSGKVQNGLRRGVIEGIKVIEIYIPYSNYDSLLERSMSFLKYSIHGIKIVLKEDYDLLFATSTPLTASIPGIFSRFFHPKKKFIFEVRDLWPELPKAMGVVRNPLIILGLSILEKMSYLAMHGGIALSPGIKDGMRKRSPKNKEIDLIPNGCDLELFQPAPSEVKIEKALLRKLSEIIEKGDFIAVFTGAHGIANGLDAVLDAASISKRENSRVKYVFIGDGKLKPQLVERAKKEKLNNCIFLDKVSKTELAIIIQEADVGMMILDNVPAFYYGTSPNKFFDYISLGLPVINNYPGWLADMINDYHCGLVVPPDDPVAFAKALDEFASSPDRCRQMGENSRKLAEEKFNREDLSSKFVSYLTKFYSSSSNITE